MSPCGRSQVTQRLRTTFDRLRHDPDVFLSPVSIWEITIMQAAVLLLQGRGRQTAGQLAAQLDVSTRTIYRDMLALGTAGIPVYADASGYRLVDGYQTRSDRPHRRRGTWASAPELPALTAELGLAQAVAAAQLSLPPPCRRSPGTRRPGCGIVRPRRPQAGLAGMVRAHLPGGNTGANASTAIRRWHAVVDRRLEPYGLVLKAGAQAWPRSMQARGLASASAPANTAAVPLRPPRSPRGIRR